MKCYKCGYDLVEANKDELYENIYRCPKCGNYNLCDEDES